MSLTSGDGANFRGVPAFVDSPLTWPKQYDAHFGVLASSHHILDLDPNHPPSNMGHKKECFPDGTPLDTRPPRVKRKKPTADGPASDELVTPGDTKDLNNNQASTSKKPKPIVDKDAPKRSARFRKK